MIFWRNLTAALVRAQKEYGVNAEIIVAILGVYLVSSYVYLGKAPLWSFISAAARRMLSFVEWLPLRVAGADLAPVAGIALVLLVCEISARWMPALYRHLPGR